MTVYLRAYDYRTGKKPTPIILPVRFTSRELAWEAVHVARRRDSDLMRVGFTTQIGANW